MSDCYDNPIKAWFIEFLVTILLLFTAWGIIYLTEKETTPPTTNTPP